MRFDLPLPPSTNNAYFNVKGRGRAPSAATLRWKGEAGWTVKCAGQGRITGPYSFTILLPAKMRGDVSNRIKLAEDLFVALRVTPDDSKAVSVTAQRSDTVPDGRCVVVIEPVINI